jgi:hypothetical protein
MVYLLTQVTNIVPRFTVIDEADELLSSGWEDTMEKLFKGNGSGMLIIWYHAYLQDTNTPTDINLDGDHTYMMFSATFPKEARRMAKEYMEEDCIKIKVSASASLLTSSTDITTGWPRWQHSLKHYTADRLRQREREKPGSTRSHLL